MLFSFEETLQAEANVIQRKIISFLRPIAKKIPEMVIEGALNVWLRKSLLGEEVDIHRSYEKIIQIIVCIQKTYFNPKT